MKWVSGYIPRCFAHPKTVTHPSTNGAQHKVTLLVEINTQPLSQTATNNPYDDTTYDVCYNIIHGIVPNDRLLQFVSQHLVEDKRIDWLFQRMCRGKAIPRY